MKNLKTGRLLYTKAAILLFILFSIGITLGVSAQPASVPADYFVSKSTAAKAAKGLAVAMYQIDNTMKFSVNFENYSGKDVHIHILDNNGNVIYKETTRNKPKYIRRFDLNPLHDGQYTFVVFNKNESHKEKIHLQTSVNRTAKMAQTSNEPLAAGKNGNKLQASKDTLRSR